MTEVPGTPAGWYTDPDDATRQRYWDGQTWTENRTEPSVETAPIPVQTPEPVPGSGDRRGGRGKAIGLGVGGLVVGFILGAVAGVAGAGGSSTPSAGPTVTVTADPSAGDPAPTVTVTETGTATPTTTAKPTPVADTILPGDWLVPSEVKPGTYRTETVKNGGLCYVDQHKGDNILMQEVGESGTTIFTVKSVDNTILSLDSDCGSATKVG